LVIKNPPFKSEGRIMTTNDIQDKMPIMERLHFTDANAAQSVLGDGFRFGSARKRRSFSKPDNRKRSIIDRVTDGRHFLPPAPSIFR
jgi:hypothetical protein